MEINFVAVSSPEDIRRLAGMADEIWHEYYVELLSPEQIDYMVEKFQSESALTDQIENQGYEYFFLETQGHPVGFLGFRAEEQGVFLSKLYLLAQFRGMGYGAEAFAFLEKVCRRRDLHYIHLTVNRYNDHSVAVYKSKGYRVVEEKVTDIGRGFVMDDFIMEKEII